MRRSTLALLLWLIVTAPALAATRPGGDDPFRKDPWLTCPAGPTEMPVQWQLTTSAPCTLRWSRETGGEDGRIVSRQTGDDHLHRAVISGLVPATRYRYRVTCGGVCRGGTFRSWPAPGDTTLAFVVYGDTRSQPEIHDRVAGVIGSLLDEAGDFRTLVVSTGDLVLNGDDPGLWDEHFFSLPHLRALLAGVPLLSARGNHERSARLFSRWFPGPAADGRDYWSVDVGPLHLVVVDEYRDYSPGSVQYRWLERDLAATDRRWTILVLHQPGWTAGGHHDTADVQRFIQPLCLRYHVPLVLAGHNHYYARCTVDGVQHVTTGGGGAPLYEPDPGRPFVVAAIKRYHFCRVEISGAELRFTAQDLDGNVLDAFALRSCPHGRG